MWPSTPPPLPSLRRPCQAFEAAYTSDGVSRTANQWNEQRRLILKEAVSSRLLPAMQREARLALTARAKDHLANQCAAAMWQRVSVAPYDLRSKSSAAGGGRGGGRGGSSADDDGKAPWLRVLACCWGPGSPATTFAMLDASGGLLETLQTPFLCTRVGGGPRDGLEYTADQKVSERLGAEMRSMRF